MGEEPEETVVVKELTLEDADNVGTEDTTTSEEEAEEEEEEGAGVRG